MNTTHTYDHYFVFDEISAILREFAQKYPQYMRLSALNKTAESREIWVVEITDLSTGSFESKPAYYTDGNEHAGEVTGSMCAMYFVDYILTNADIDSEIGDLLKKTTIYVIPRKSPDGAEYYLTTPMRLRSVDKMYPYEELLPGLQLKDMDGDGVIRVMRVKTPYGVWKISQKDSRCMSKRRPDDTDDEYYNVYPEGYIEQHDGIHIPVPPEPFGNDFNRNYPVSWAPEHEQKGAGVYPLSNIETQSAADFVIHHKNIGSVITFHTHGGMFLYPPGMCASKEVCKEDMERYREIGKIATEVTSFPVVNLFDEFTPNDVRISSGAFDDWCHYDRGIPAYTIECWDLNMRAGIEYVWPRPSQKRPEDAEADFIKQLKWVGENLDGEAFMDWTPFDHPQLGMVDIGGFDYKHVFQNCPVQYLMQEVQKHTKFMLRHAKVLPRLRFESVTIQPVEGDVYHVEAVVANAGYLPTYLTNEALKLKVDNPVKVNISGQGVSIVEGKQSQKIGHLEGFSGVKAGYSFQGITTFDHDPVMKKVEWVIRIAKGTDFTVAASCATAGTIEKTIAV